MPKKKSKTARKQKRRSVIAEDLLVELGTEELPPKSLRTLGAAFGEEFWRGLVAAGLKREQDENYEVFCTPRRLAVRTPGVLLRQPDHEQERRGPAWSAAYDENGQPTKALKGFASSCGVDPRKLEMLENDKGAWVVHRTLEKGGLAKTIVPEVLESTLKKLPIARNMRWGDLESEFVRPVHWLVLLHGSRVIQAQVLSVKAGRYTYGHRFHHPGRIKLDSARDYERQLKNPGDVVADFNTRSEKIRRGAEKLAAAKGGRVVFNEALLNEVTSLVELPEPLMGAFNEDYLKMPPEVLITSMQDHQKYFPVIGKRGKLLPHFITVANLRSKRKAEVRQGNERVLRARFADAQFFWETDRKTRLEDRVQGLDEVVFHNKLGSVYAKVERTSRLAEIVAQDLGIDAGPAKHAARLAKADLMSGMVGEFPELQGVMGRYYAAHDGEDSEVALAVEEQYLPRFAGDRLPKTAVGRVLAIADKLDTIVGIFSVGEVPTGERDPFALRRAALGVLRILIEQEVNLDLQTLLRSAAAHFEGNFDLPAVCSQVYEFMMDRLRAYYAERGVRYDVFEAVRSSRPTRPLDFDKRVSAVMAFRKLKEAESLTAANKRIRNILKQGGRIDWNHVSKMLLQEPAEKDLFHAVEKLEKDLEPVFEAGEYTRAMKQLAALRPQVDVFFDKVMVMVDEEAVRDNRLALLDSVSRLFLRIADLSKLQG